nr:hypothetical protein [Neisseria iguanae]
MYTCQNENLSNLFDAINALKALDWFPASVRDIRAFRIEQRSDFTKSMRY